MFFCPFCSTLLLVVPHVEGNAFVCATCRYLHSVASASRRAPTNAFGEPILTIQHSLVAHNRKLMDDQGEPAADTSNAEAGSATSASPAVAKTETSTAMDASAEGGQITTIQCQNEDNPCSSTKAYFIQIQMRSADEPATVFFKCVECGHQWRQD